MEFLNWSIQHGWKRLDGYVVPQWFEGACFLDTLQKESPVVSEDMMAPSEDSDDNDVNEETWSDDSETY